MNNKLSKRLLAIAGMIEDGKIVYDVGCDHAYLDIYLTLYRNNITCYAIDIRPSVVKIAKENIKNAGLKIPVILNNGLENMDINDDSTVVLAGMGTRTILKIIKNKNIPEMIIQSNDDLFLLRTELMNLGYKITEEKLIFEFGYYYVFIKVKLENKIEYSYEQLLLGPQLLKNKDYLFNNYLHYQLKKYKKMMNDIPLELIEKKEPIKRNIDIVLKNIN